MILIPHNSDLETPKEIPQSVVIVENIYIKEYLYILLSPEEVEEGIDTGKIRKFVRSQYVSKFRDEDFNVIFYKKV